MSTTVSLRLSPTGAAGKFSDSRSEQEDVIVTREILCTLQNKLQLNPFDFDVCTKLIENYALLGDVEAVTRFREHAAIFCPTTEEFWMTWIYDEKETLASATSFSQELAAERRVVQLYRSSVAACPTADLWVAYLKFLNQRRLAATRSGSVSRTPPISATHIRRTCESAVRDLGLHATEGPKIWSFYRHVEQMLLQRLLERSTSVSGGTEKLDVDGSPTHSETSSGAEDLSQTLKVEQQQAERIRNLFCRQMCLPLAGLQDLWDEYRIFEAELPVSLRATEDITASVAELHEIGMCEWEKRKALELQVMMSEDDKVETIQRLSAGWSEYIRFERAINIGNNQSRVNTLYLRACEDLGHLRLDLWFAWSHWVVTEMKDPGRAVMVLDRAVRLHPTNCKLWTSYLAYQRERKPADWERNRQIFFRALRGLDLQRRPQDVVTLTEAAADCLLHAMRLQLASQEKNMFTLDKIIPNDTLLEIKSTNDTTIQLSQPNELLEDISSHVKLQQLSKQPFDTITPPQGATSSISSDSTECQLKNIFNSRLQHKGLHCEMNSPLSSLTKASYIREIFLKAENQLLKSLCDVVCLTTKKQYNLREMKSCLNDSVQDDDSYATPTVQDRLNQHQQQHHIDTKLNLTDIELIEDTPDGTLQKGIFQAIQDVWRKWLRIEAGILKDYDYSHSICKRILCLSTVDSLLEIIISENQIDFQSVIMPMNFEVNLKNTNGDDWAAVAEAIIATWDSNDRYESVHRLMASGDQFIILRREPFLIRWLQLEHLYGTSESINEVSQLLGHQSCHITSSSPPNPLHKPLLSSSWDFGTNEDGNAVLSEQADTTVMRVTLDQLKSRREKRRRRFSESESEAALSDTSSDSGSLPNNLVSLNSPFGVCGKKRLRVPGGLSSCCPSSFTGLPCNREPTMLHIMNSPKSHGPILEPTFNLPLDHVVSINSKGRRRQPNGSIRVVSSPSSLSNNILGPALSPQEIQSMERVTRSTWDGHECGDPSTAPPVPPITSSMSPLRRRSLSNSSTSSAQSTHHSPGSSTSEPTSSHLASTTTPPPRPFFSTTPYLSAECPADQYDIDDVEDEGHCLKRPKIEFETKEINAMTTHLIEDSSNHKTVFGPLPKEGKHYRQQLALHQDAVNSDQITHLNHLCVDELLGKQNESCTLYVSNLDHSVTVNDIRDIFKDSEGLIDIRLIKDFKQRSKGFCYIEFTSPEAAKTAKELHQHVIIHNRQITVSLSQPTVPTYEPTTVFLSGLSPSIFTVPLKTIETEIAAAISSETERLLGHMIRPTTIRLRQNEEQQILKGYGYVDFATKEMTADILKTLRHPLNFVGLEGSFILAPSIPMKRHKWILAPENKEKKKRDELHGQQHTLLKPESNTLFVKNLSFSTDESQLKTHFETIAPVQSVLLCRKPDGKTKGFGFVTFSSEADAFSGRMLHNSILDGRDISVSQSHRIPTVPKQVSLPIISEISVPQHRPRLQLHSELRLKTECQTIPSTDELNHDSITGSSHTLTNKDFRKFLEM